MYIYDTSYCSMYVYWKVTDWGRICCLDLVMNVSYGNGNGNEFI